MSQDIFGEENVDDPLEFSGISGSATPSTGSHSPASQPHSQPAAQPQPAQPQPKVYYCTYPTCKNKKGLKTLRGFINHEAAHRIKDINDKRPNADKLRTIVEDVMQNVLVDMRKEAVTVTERNAVEELMTRKGSVEWTVLTDCISYPMYQDLSAKNKLLPLNQHEEAQRQLNYRLNDDAYFRDVKVKLQENSDISDDVAARLVFRISFKMLEKLQLFIAREMLQGVQPSSSSISEEGRLREMTVVQETAFLESVGELLRSHFIKTNVSVSRHKMKDCLKNNFVQSENIVCGISFVNKNCWFSANENSIILTDNAIEFFKMVEGFWQDLKTAEKTPTASEIVNKIYESHQALNLWFFLTNCYFSEEDSLVFLKEMVKTFVSRSIRSEQGRVSRLEEHSIRESQAALRVHLHRNLHTTDTPQNE